MTRAEKALALCEQLLVKKVGAQVGEGYVRRWFARQHALLLSVLGQIFPESASPPHLEWRPAARSEGYPMELASTGAGQYQLVVQPEGGRIVRFVPSAPSAGGSVVLYRGENDKEARAAALAHSGALRSTSSPRLFPVDPTQEVRPTVNRGGTVLHEFGDPRTPEALTDAIARTEAERTLATEARAAYERGEASDAQGVVAGNELLRTAGALRILRQSLSKAQQEAAPAAPQAPTTPAPPAPLDIPPDEWSAPQRTAANLAAVQVLAAAEQEQRPLSEGERQLVLRYSGWGGLSLEKAQGKLPAAWKPEERGLIHEYYTPSRVAAEVARLIKPLLPDLTNEEGLIPALEPSAGIGRFVNACSGPGFEQVRFTAVEYSAISGRLLQMLRPDVKVVPGTPFERWVSENEMGAGGTLRLLLSNPPYGPRGASLTEDPDKSYRQGVLKQKAYAYFLCRALDLLARNGLGVFLIPYGFLTGQNAALRGLRERILRRHHLSTAYRMPSADESGKVTLFPGANLVTDLLFFRARGGELASVLPEDEAILNGQYFETYPLHILGKVVGKGGDEDDTSRKPRWGYEVRGVFSGLPDLVEREMCRGCEVRSFRAEVSKKAKPAAIELPERIKAAVLLGDRTSDFLRARAAGQTGDAAAAERAAALYAELREALTAWAAQHGNPHDDKALDEFGTLPDLVALRSAFRGDGSLAALFDEAPRYEPRYLGGPEDIAAQAEFLYQSRREVTLSALSAFHDQVGTAERSANELLLSLVTAGWCRDGEVFLPERDYYTGHLWPRYDRARAAAQGGDPQAGMQAARLLEAIKPLTIDEIGAEPRMGFVPTEVLRAWMVEWCGLQLPPLEREGGVLKISTMSYVGFSFTEEQTATIRAKVCLGYLNHDYTFFKIPSSLTVGGAEIRCEKQYKEIVGASGRAMEVEESDKEKQDRCRLDYHARAVEHFRAFLAREPGLTRELETHYNRVFRGFVTPTYGKDEVKIARWRGTFVLKPHQRAGARRLLANHGGLLAFDVGVGKTLTGIATIAKAREEGWARRPVVLVPNTIIWKWLKEFHKALPDYRVVVIGSKRFELTRGPKKGQITSEVDTPEERALKWRGFQAGEYDVALCTYSMLGRTQLRAESITNWVDRSPPVLRELGLRARNLLADLEKSKSTRKPSKAGEARQAQRADLQTLLAGISDMSERERAVFHETRDRWVAERMEPSEKPDPGIFWEDLGVDLIVIDEAQNFKNLFSVGEREGGQPKYLGAIQEGSNRAWDLALRTALVRQKTGGTGVILLSATPAKNSPIEYFSLLSYVDEAAWAKLGILDAEIFVDRYLRLEYKKTLENDGEWKSRSIVAGFKNLDELRDLVFRLSEFRTAEEVGLKLPPVERKDVLVDMDERQRQKYRGYVTTLQELRRTLATNPQAKYAMLGTLQKMALVSLHPDLDAGNWTWDSASAWDSPHAPKLDGVRDRILTKPDCGHIVFCDNVAVHAWMVRVLVEAGIKRERIAVLNGHLAAKPAERQAIAEGFNGDEEGGIAPIYDVVLANAVAYEGIDLQVRTCTVHHLDLPWEPATLQQRNGRAVRQGNKQAVIAIYYYLSKRSFDANRLQMILGKLRWMTDLIATADRETSNPAAGSEMTADQMLLMVAEDEEAARRFVAEMERAREEEVKTQVKKQCWEALRAIVTKTASIGEDEILSAQRRKEIAELSAYLASVDPVIWPFLFLADLARQGVPFVFKLPEVLWDGAHLAAGAIKVEWAVSGGAVSVREFGSYQWTAAEDEENKLAIRAQQEALKDGLASAFLQPWPEEEDRAAWSASLAEWIAQYGANGWQKWEALGLEHAPARWRELVWDGFGPELIEALRLRTRYPTLGVPVRRGAGLALLSSSALQGKEADVLPFTEEGYAEFVARAPQQEAVKWQELYAAALAWFGKKIPRGLLVKKEPALADATRAA